MLDLPVRLKGAKVQVLQLSKRNPLLIMLGKELEWGLGRVRERTRAYQVDQNG